MTIRGTKYQRYPYPGSEIEILRLVNCNDDDYDMELNGKIIKVSKNDFDKMVELEPDAYMNIMITNSKLDGEDNKDVYVCVNKCIDLKHGIQLPCIILRQNTYSQSKNSFQTMDKIYVGECYNKYSLENVDINTVLEFDEIYDDGKCSIALYVDDTINEIITSIGKDITKYDDTLKEIKKKGNSMVLGYCDSLKDLLNENNFLLNYRLAFNIMQLDFPIELKNNIDENGNIILNNKQKARMENSLQKYITNVIIIKYDKDIDISKIVNKTHMMISDSNGKIYLMSYAVSGEYPVDNDIYNALNNYK